MSGFSDVSKGINASESGVPSFETYTADEKEDSGLNEDEILMERESSSEEEEENGALDDENNKRKRKKNIFSDSQDWEYNAKKKKQEVASYGMQGLWCIRTKES
ncbi:uncharacterized protein LOC115874094 [Sitophilus oryzae]|uniref:Uncharacterized protein LOC115874094 n=1 Tax=Sitophilus oryzae TaxID=7048 RepID=A0A6J2X1E2_SITOR|nr:uncharacterized protein LOC115874094 [Sitophilus oryzae]